MKDIYNKYEEAIIEKGETYLQEKIDQLPNIFQKQLVKTALISSTIHPKRRRYPMDYIYECILMRIKSKKLYDHIRNRNLLPLPCKETLKNYIENLESEFGFQESVFHVMKEKCGKLAAAERRGKILDFMSLIMRFSEV